MSTIPRRAFGVGAALAAIASCSSPRPPARTTVSGRVVSLDTGQGAPGREVILRHFRAPEQLVLTDEAGAYRFTNVAADSATYELRVRRAANDKEYLLRETEKGATSTSMLFDVKDTPKDVGTLFIVEHESDLADVFVPVCQTGQAMPTALAQHVIFESKDGKAWKGGSLTTAWTAPWPALVCIETKSKQVGIYAGSTAAARGGRPAGRAFETTWVVRLYRPKGAVLRTTVSASPPAYMDAGDDGHGDPSSKLSDWLAGLR